MPADTAPLQKPRSIEPDPKDVVVFVYPDTVDGWLAAWVFREACKKHKIPAVFTKHGEPLPDVTNRNVIEVDQDPLAAAAECPSGARSCLVFSRTRAKQGGVIPFAKWKRTFPFGIEKLTEGENVGTVVSTDSLALSLWSFFNTEKAPRLIEHINAQVTGSPFNDTAAIHVCVESYMPLDFRTIDRLIDACNDRPKREMLVVGGQAILRHLARKS